MAEKKNGDEKKDDSLEKMTDEQLELMLSEHSPIRLRQGKDGHWYIPDPNRPQKYLRIM